MIVDAFSNAFQEGGVIDTADPEFKVKQGEKVNIFVSVMMKVQLKFR